MDDDVFAQMMEGLRSAGKSASDGGKKKKLKWDPPADPSAPTTVELPETEIKPDEFVGPPLSAATPPPVQGVTGPAGYDGSPAEQGAVNRIDLNALQDAAPSAPPALPAVQLPAPQPPEAVIHSDMGASKKPVSQQKVAESRPAAQEQDKAVETATAKEDKPDARMLALGERQKGIDKDRMKSLEEAANARNMSTEEMIAMALVTLLPTIVGGIAGSALAGKAGGAAGVAGGLQGGSQGLNNLIAQKQKDREAAQAEAARLGQRSDALEGEMGQRQGQLENMAEHDKTRAANKDLTLLKEQGDTQRAREANATHVRTANIGAYAHLKAAKIAADGAISRAEARAQAAEQGGEMKEYQGKVSGLASSMLGAQHVLTKMDRPDLLNSFRSWGALKNALASNDPTTQKYARAVELFLDAAARDESGAAINEQEYDRYFNMYFPRNTSSQEDVQYAKSLREMRLDNMLRRAGPQGARAAVQSYQSAFGGGQQQQAPAPQPGQVPGQASQQQPQGGNLTQKWGAGR